MTVQHQAKRIEAPNGSSTIADRVRYLRDFHWLGDTARMAQATGVQVSTIKHLIKGRTLPHAQFSGVMSDLARKPIRRSWLVTGKGSWKLGQFELPERDQQEPLPISAAVPAEPKLSPLAGRIATVRDKLWRTDTFRMAEHTGIAFDRLCGILDGKAEPTDDDAQAILSTPDCPIALDWLIQGKGPMWASVVKGPEPIPEPVKAEPVKPDPILDPPAATTPPPGDAIGTFLAIAERLRSLDADFRAFRTGLESRVSMQLNSIATDLAQTGKRLNGRIDEIAKAPPIATAIEPILERLRKLEDQHGVLVKGDYMVAEECKAEAAARSDAIESKLDDSLDDLRDSIRRIPEAIEEIRSRLDRIEATAIPAPTPSPAPAKAGKPKTEAELDPDAVISIAAWTGLPGSHQRVIRDEGDRKTCGRRMVIAYRELGLPNAARNSNALTYPVKHLRAYAAWLASAGLVPEAEAFVAHCRKTNCLA